MARRGRWTWSIVAFAMACTGCGTAGLIVKPPVSQACASSGLKKCDALTDAVVAYVGGDESAAELELRAVAAANTPEAIRVFSQTVRPLVAGIGGDVEASVGAVLDILESPAPGSRGVSPTDGPKSPAARARRNRDALAAREAHVTRASLLRTGMVRPSTEPRARQCDRTSFTAEEGRCTEARALVGPITITNLYASGGCTDELFIYAGHVANPHWIVSLLPTASLNLAGQLVVDDAEEVFIGTHAAIDAAPTGLRCTVVWSGVRPDPNE